MKKLLFAALLFFITQPAYALLSPLNQSREEIKAILQSNEIETHVPQSIPILAIQRMGNGYMIVTQDRQVQVEIHYLPTTQPGKQPFKLIFHEAVPFNKSPK